MIARTENIRPTRRHVLGSALAASLATLAPGRLLATESAARPRFGPETPFSFTRLAAEALRLAHEPYRPPLIRYSERLDAIDFDNHNKIRFRAEEALFADGEGPFPVEAFHPGRYFKEPVSIHLVENGKARELLFDPGLFLYADTPALTGLPTDLGFAGFRVLNGRGQADWLAFLGATYFRSAGESGQFGLSARGIAIDTALPTGEEFPRFSSFWLEEPTGDSIVISALLDGPSLTGAFRIGASRPKGVVMEVEALLYPRRRIERLGVAPLTSMFWYSESSRRGRVDWRPQVHDSDGLAIWTGAGEHIWRPLNNPPTVQTSSFADNGPKGFGLLQRDRDFANYQDDGVFYERRPSLWVEPLGDWGPGAVQLVEIPTSDEIHDNIVAYWVPAKPVEAGSEWRFAYRLTWADAAPIGQPLGTTAATRVGIAGNPAEPAVPGTHKLVVDFSGGRLAGLARETKVRPVIDVGRGAVKGPFVVPVIGTRIWRAFFDYHPADDDPVDIRMYLESGGEALTETWIFQYIPKGLG